MTKKDLIDSVAQATGFTKKDVGIVLNALKDVTYNALASHDSVKIIDGIVLDTRFKEARVGRNPATGADIQIAAKYVPKARFGKRLKEYING